MSRKYKKLGKGYEGPFSVSTIIDSTDHVPSSVVLPSSRSKNKLIRETVKDVEKELGIDKDREKDTFRYVHRKIDLKGDSDKVYYAEGFIYQMYTTYLDTKIQDATTERLNARLQKLDVEEGEYTNKLNDLESIGKEK